MNASLWVRLVAEEEEQGRESPSETERWEKEKREHRSKWIQKHRPERPHGDEPAPRDRNDEQDRTNRG